MRAEYVFVHVNLNAARKICVNYNKYNIYCYILLCNYKIIVSSNLMKYILSKVLCHKYPYKVSIFIGAFSVRNRRMNSIVIVYRSF